MIHFFSEFDAANLMPLEFITSRQNHEIGKAITLGFRPEDLRIKPSTRD
ncbi:hypothetical protein LB452_05655 [Psychroflexus sp. CAK8W]|uniref:Uncharacterized protein n=1 Tax=Psychroflexus longus TaxID=2873596 RepID=A0ABS7XI49_9FLAO|nr:hypothetical protein [Psychroflexus longus]MBZ9778405.1 hypothetical protein [Psychroflexus longus]